MGGDSMQVDPATLKAAAQGIGGVVDELKSLGIEETGAAGRGFGSLKLSGLQAGHDDVKAAFDSFCDRWSWGVRSLVQDADHIARALHINAGTYSGADQAVEDSLKVLVNHAVGDPRTPEDVAENRSWHDTILQNPYANADYSPESFDKAFDTAKQAWGSVEHDVTHNQNPIFGSVPDMGDR